MRIDLNELAGFFTQRETRTLAGRAGGAASVLNYLSLMSDGPPAGALGNAPSHDPTLRSQAQLRTARGKLAGCALHEVPVGKPELVATFSAVPHGGDPGDETLRATAPAWISPAHDVR